MLTAETLASLRSLHVSAGALVGLIDGWEGPAERWWGRAWRPVTMLPPDPRDPYRVYEVRQRFFMDDEARQWTCGIILPGSFDGFRLPLTRPESRHRVAVVMAAGLKCSACHGNAPDWCGCPACSGTNYLRKPAPIWHLLPATEIGPAGLPAERVEHSAALIACSVARVLVGLGPVRGFERLPDIRHTRCVAQHFAGASTYIAATEADRDYFVGRDLSSHPGWEWGDESGPEVGEAALAILREKAPRAGFALLAPDAPPVLPWPQLNEVPHAR